MKPTHAACFNELKELCRKYDMSFHSESDIEAIFYEGNKFDKFTRYTFPGRINIRTDSVDTKVIIPPPETTGDKND